MKIKTFLSICLFSTFNLFGAIPDHFKKCPDKANNHNLKNIDFIYVINLDRRPERFEDFNKRINPYGIYPYRFSAVDGASMTIDTINDVGLKFQPWMKAGIMGTYYYQDEEGQVQHAHEIIHDPNKTYFAHCVAKGPIAIMLSHLSVLQDAYDSGYETIWVMEDDMEIIRDPNVLPELIDKLDALVGKDGWDILFTDRDQKKQNGEYNSCYWHANRPNFTPWSAAVFANRQIISDDFQKIGARWGSHSMILRRSGIEKLLDFVKVYRIFFPYDMDYILPSNIDEDIKLYTLLNDVVSNQPDSISDNK